MRQIIHVSDQVHGGAAVACRRLVKALCERHGKRAVLIAGETTLGSGAVSANAWPSLMDAITYRLVSRCTHRERVLRYVAERNGCRAVCRTARLFSADLFHLHGLHEGLSFDLLARVGRDAPVVWTLHDMWPITGYCYYSYHCEKYVSGCQGDCPQLGRCGAAVRAPAVEWQRRNRAFKKMGNRLVIVAPSRWLADCANRRFEGLIRVEHIPNGVDLGVFRPLGDKAACRKVLGLPIDRPIVLTGAIALDDSRKGTSILPKICADLATAMKVAPVLVGLGGQSLQTSFGNVLVAGMVADERLMNLFYNAADVFVLPSRADNLPNMLVEAVAAGTSVVASDIGGCSDVVRDGDTGFLAVVDDAISMGYAVQRVLLASPVQQAQLGMRCRALAEREYDVRLQAARYCKIYDELVACQQGGDGGKR